MKRVLILAAAASALALAGCETATPYQPLGAQNAQAPGGYSDQQIENNRWQVRFAGNSLTSRQTVERYLLYRSAQLTQRQGYQWFQAVDRHTNKQTQVFDDPDPFDAGFDPYWGFYNPGFGWGYGYAGDPFWGQPWGGFDISTVTKYTATVQIVMGHGEKPAGDFHAYNAQQVIDHLGPTIQYPKSS